MQIHAAAASTGAAAGNDQMQMMRDAYFADAARLYNR